VLNHELINSLADLGAARQVSFHSQVGVLRHISYRPRLETPHECILNAMAFAFDIEIPIGPLSDIVNHLQSFEILAFGAIVIVRVDVLNCKQTQITAHLVIRSQVSFRCRIQRAIKDS
jgi:hypothetical protein